MAIKISNRIKLLIVLLGGIIISAFFYIYQKVFGGKAEIIPANKFIVGEKNNTVVEQKNEEVVAVFYSNSPSKGIDEVVGRTGDLDFIKPGQKVLVKPNVNNNDQAPGTTYPDSVAEVVKLAKAKGAYVVVGDRSNFNYDTIDSMKKTGIYDAVIKAGADEVVGFENEDWIRVSSEKAKNWPNGFRIPKRLMEFDHIISVPVLHTHSITGHSLAIKNLVGLIHPTDRILFHSSKNTQEMISEISLIIKPTLTVIDGTKAFIKGGPSHGTLAETKVYLASRDVLIADVVGVSLLQKHGANFPSDYIWKSEQIKHFLDLGLSNFSKEKIEEEVNNLHLI